MEQQQQQQQQQYQQQQYQQNDNYHKVRKQTVRSAGIPVPVRVSATS
jgi:hypothetical protein